MSRHLARTDVFARLQRIVKDANGNKNEAARRLEISPQYLGDVLAGRRTIGPAILRGLGLRRVEAFEEVRP